MVKKAFTATVAVVVLIVLTIPMAFAASHKDIPVVGRETSSIISIKAKAADAKNGVGQDDKPGFVSTQGLKRSIVLHDKTLLILDTANATPATMGSLNISDLRDNDELVLMISFDGNTIAVSCNGKTPDIMVLDKSFYEHLTSTSNTLYFDDKVEVTFLASMPEEKAPDNGSPNNDDDGGGTGVVNEGADLSEIITALQSLEDKVEKRIQGLEGRLAMNWIYIVASFLAGMLGGFVSALGIFVFRKKGKKSTTCAVIYKVTGGNASLTAHIDNMAIKSGASVQKGSDVLFKARPNSGYHVREWRLNGAVVGDQTDTYTLTDLSAAATVTAMVEKGRKTTTFTVNYNVLDGNASLTANIVDGTPINSGDSVQKGCSVEFTATLEMGYCVKEWRLNGNVVGNDSNTYILNGISAAAVVTLVVVKVKHIDIDAAVLLAYQGDFSELEYYKAKTDKQLVWFVYPDTNVLNKIRSGYLHTKLPFYYDRSMDVPYVVVYDDRGVAKLYLNPYVFNTTRYRMSRELDDKTSVSVCFTVSTINDYKLPISSQNPALVSFERDAQQMGLGRFILQQPGVIKTTVTTQ